MSSNKCAVSEVKALIMPDAPAGTSAVFIVVAASSAFRVETVGWLPAPQRDRKPRLAGGITVAFSEYAVALTGTPHAEAVTRKSRRSAGPIRGPPNGPAVPSVSTIRH